MLISECQFYEWFHEIGSVFFRITKYVYAAEPLIPHTSCTTIFPREFFPFPIMYFAPHLCIASSMGLGLLPMSVSEYSTRGGTSW